MLSSNASWRLRASLGVAALLIVGAAQGQYKKLLLTDLGLLPNGLVNRPAKMNLGARVVGFTQMPNTTSAFLFDNPVLYDLGLLPGRTSARANWINRFDTIVGSSGDGATERAFIWNNGTMGTVAAPGRPSRGVGVNDNGVIALNFMDLALPEAGLMLGGALVYPLPNTGVFFNHQVTAISNMPWVAGDGIKLSDFTPSCWRLDFSDPANNVEEVDPRLDAADEPHINDLSDVFFDPATVEPTMVGVTGPYIKDGFGVPKYYQPVPFISLGSTFYYPILLPGDTIGEANGVNNSAAVVGRSGKFEVRNGIGLYTWHACIYLPLLIEDPFWIALPLTDFMPANSGITVDNLYDINDLGQMVGTYTVAGKTKGILLTPTITPIALNVDELNLPGGTDTVGQVVIDDLAPFGGLIVNLKVNNGIVSVPPTVTVPFSKDNVKFTIKSAPVVTATNVVLTAERNGYSVSTSLHILPTALDAINITPTFITGGQKANATAVLLGTAKTGGFKVTLSSSNTSAAIVPASVTIPSGSSQAPFFVYTLVVQSNKVVTISGTANGITRTRNMTVATPFLQELNLASSSCFGTQTVGGYVVTSGKALAPGAIVSLSSSSPGVATVPASVTVLTGTQVASFQVHTVLLRFNTNVTISGSFNTQTRSKTLTVKAASLYSITTTPTTIKGGSFASGRATLDWLPFTGGAVVALESSNVGVASTPATVTVPVGNNKANFVITTQTVVADTPVTITGTYQGTTKTATLTVTP